MSAALPALGFYGKVPAAGDFLSRGLPREMTGRWDRWMERALPEAMAVGGGGLWAIRAGPGVLWDRPVSGAFRLSADRGGRRFPFLVAVGGLALAPDDPWFAAAGELVQAAVAGLGPEAIAAGLDALPHTARAPALSDAAEIWGLGLGPEDAQALFRFPSLGALAEGGLTAVFRAGGPAAPVGAPPEDAFDPAESAALAAPAPPAAPAAERVGLDDLMGFLDDPASPATKSEADGRVGLDELFGDLDRPKPERDMP